MSNDNNLEQVLKVYRVSNLPTELSWKQHWARETFSNPDLYLCDREEQLQFYKRLKEGQVTIMHGIRGMVGEVHTLDKILEILSSQENKKKEKLKRDAIFSTATGQRPVGEDAYNTWTGFQVIDMDIKNKKISDKLKVLIFNVLRKCNWFLGVAKSSSGEGLHVYTKIAVPEGDDINKKKALYLVNFRHKFSFVYIACLQAMDELGFTKEQLMKWLDDAMCRPQQGAIIGYDPHPLINTGFFEDFIYVNFENDEVNKSNIDWLVHPDLREKFKREDWAMKSDATEAHVNVAEAPTPNIDTHIKFHYKHEDRWRLANTLVKLYGYIDGYKYLRAICSNEVKDMELKSDCQTAKRHSKEIDVWAVNRLNSVHGFKIKLNIKQEDLQESDIFASMDQIENPTQLRESLATYKFHLGKDGYLGDIRNEIIDKIGQITLLEAGAGVGKTEMVKQLVRDGKKIVMVMPFTSTIKSKIEKNPEWDYAYGSKDVNRILGKKPGICVTIDKFSRMSPPEIKAAGYDYIFLDESHLMFQSDYRPVMADTVHLIANCIDLPIILMSGTPSGELSFFPNIVHIKVTKDDTRKKLFQVCMTETTKDLMFHMCRQMAKDIAEGKRILYPTNDGTLYSKQIEAGVKYFLEKDYAIFGGVKLAYYKKANQGEVFMDKINFDKTVADTQILMCTNYLSVGVDILDRWDFNIYFSDLMMPQEVEQFANRLRSHDLFIHCYVAKNDADGNSRFLNRYKPMDMRLDEKEKTRVQLMVDTANDSLTEKGEKYKSNALAANIINVNSYVRYDGESNEYYLHKIGYALVEFELHYRNYVQQLPVLMKGMQAYGYEVTSIDLKSFQLEGNEIFRDLKNSIKMAYDEQLKLNATYVTELISFINDDNLTIFKDALAGKYQIIKGDDWNVPKGTNIMVVKSIEVFEKVIPIFVSLTKLYEPDKIREIFEFCRKNNGSYNFAAIKRVRQLVNIMYNQKYGRLALPMEEFIKHTYEFTEYEYVNKNEINQFIREFADEYTLRIINNTRIKQGLVPMATLDRDKVEKFTELCQKVFGQMFRCIVTISRPDPAGMVKVQRIELLWQTREEHEAEMAEIYGLDEFMSMLEPEDVNIEYVNYDEIDYDSLDDLPED